MVTPVNSATSSSTLPDGALAKAIGGNDSLGQDAFLKLLVAQLKNQDPLNPQQNYEFVAQLAQFSSLEQSVGINTRLDQLAAQNQGLQNSQVVGLVGKQATVKGSIVSLAGQGIAVPVTFSLDSAAGSASVVIKNAAGKTVRTLPVGARAAGAVSLLWNGQDDNGLPQPAGPYQVTVTAKGPAGGPVGATQQSNGTVKSISFDQGFPVIHLDNGVTAPIGDLISVSPTSTNP